MGNPNSKSSFKNNNLSKQINFMGNPSDNHSKYSGIKSADRDNDVLTKFTWNYGGNTVYLTGSFNNWKKNIPMEKLGDQFCITLLLPRQVHQYKFIVDGEWRFSPEDATMSDDNGYINNYIDTTNFEPLIQGNNKNNIDDLSGPLYPKHSKQHSKQKTKIDKKQQYAKYAPKLPPHYEYCLYLGKKGAQNVNINGIGSLSSNKSLFGTQNSNQGQSNMMSISLMGEEENFSPINKYQRMEDTIKMDNNSHSKDYIKLGEERDNYEATLTQQQVEYLFKTPHSLSMPTHITLDHIMTQEGDWYSAMAITQRFKQKYTTFTYFTIDKMGGGNSDRQMNSSSMDDHHYYQGNRNLSHHNSSTF